MALILKYLVLNKKKSALNWKHGKVVPIDFFVESYDDWFLFVDPKKVNKMKTLEQSTLENSYYSTICY